MAYRIKSEDSIEKSIWKNIIKKQVPNVDWQKFNNQFKKLLRWIKKECIDIPNICPAEVDKIDDMLEKLYQYGITDILVEGGSTVNSSFLQQGAINKYVIYIAPKVLGGRLSLTPFAGHNPSTMDEAWAVEFASFEQVGQDLRIIAYPKKTEGN